ncbi:MAG: hypothetical protein GOMPHAMPRED_004808 [Gomphillus americanus]|uniref:Zn(2)-C6 fungal-type domain-containing protein n=1 Tax=Gomphillus americanus TaxID=1940652 RepID=A0A8H3I6F4_9LECA|nr:MAG: hypothetical protein GOMPHAMPRED_004808 [Gomphillus americanus]
MPSNVETKFAMENTMDDQEPQINNHPYPTRRTTALSLSQGSLGSGGNLQQIVRGDDIPSSLDRPKTVSFELLVDEARKARARLPMRVQIHPHDSNEDIISTVKGFFGLYDDPQGVSFEDSHGNSIIARYENFSNNTTVSVRIIADHSLPNEAQSSWGCRHGSPQRTRTFEDNTPILPPPQPAQILNYGQPPSRPMSRISRKESVSPKPANSRLHTSTKNRPRPLAKGQSTSFQAGLDELNDAHNGYSSSDGIAASVSSRKARSEQLATAEISVDNILEGGRRKRAKFESSELPLFVPPQVPAPNSISSVSPQRRSNVVESDSPFTRPQQRSFSYQIPIQSPQGDGFGPAISGGSKQGGFTVPAVPNHNHLLRDRSSGASYSNRSSLGSSTYPKGHNVLPTPDPTIASCISDEDVALQLMRLGEATNFSHGRHSASTFDDSLSGRADIASSTSNNSEDEAEEDSKIMLPAINTEYQVSGVNDIHDQARKQSTENWPSTDDIDPSGDDIDDDYEDQPLKSEGDEHIHKKQKMTKPRKIGTKASNGIKPPFAKKSKQHSTPGNFTLPMSPISGTSQSRKASLASTTNMSYTLGPDEDDLSSKPRCQRCRKSKKGCDRQRPCGRCRDAGIGIEGCISEDENNGRKGRYGRHMGVTIKKTSEPNTINGPQRSSAIQPGAIAATDSSKKRKRS